MCSKDGKSFGQPSMYNKGLYKAIKFFGSQESLGKAVGKTQQAVSIWLKEERIPYEIAIQIVAATKGYVTLQELVPEKKEVNRALEKITRLARGTIFAEISISDIHLDNQICPIFRDENALEDMAEDEFMRPVLIDSDDRLITCKCRIRARQLQRFKTVMCYALDLKNILKGEQRIDALLVQFPFSERMALGYRLNQTIGNRQGQRTDLTRRDKYSEVKSDRTRDWIANLIGFNSDFSLRCADKVMKKGSSLLIHAMDIKMISISKAAKIVDLAHEEQRHYIESLQGSKQFKNYSLNS
jgi:hypothetical protein